jgi:hypothetical protein
VIFTHCEKQRSRSHLDKTGQYQVQALKETQKLVKLFVKLLTLWKLVNININ